MNKKLNPRRTSTANRVKSSLTRMINRFSLQAETNNEPERSVRQPIYTRLLSSRFSNEDVWQFSGFAEIHRDS